MTSINVDNGRLDRNDGGHDTSQSSRTGASHDILASDPDQVPVVRLFPRSSAAPQFERW